MATMTPQQIAAAAQKRAAAIAARKANGGMTVRQMRAAQAAARAQATGQPYTPPAPSSSSSNGTRTRRTKKAAFATPKPNARALTLVALAAIENVLVVKAAEKGITAAMQNDFERYQKLKALALGPVANAATQNEADVALRMSLISLIKLTF